MAMTQAQARIEHMVDTIVRELHESGTHLDDEDRAVMCAVVGRQLKSAEGMLLTEFFELSARVGDAARVIREAQAMMGAPVSVPLNMAHPSDAYRNVDFITPRDHAPQPNGVLMTNKGPVTLTPAEQAQKDRLRIEREAREMAAESHVVAAKLEQPS